MKRVTDRTISESNREVANNLLYYVYLAVGGSSASAIRIQSRPTGPGREEDGKWEYIWSIQPGINNNQKGCRRAMVPVDCRFIERSEVVESGKLRSPMM